jgi:hypothetical protein
LRNNIHEGLLGVVELDGAPGLLPEDVVDILECLLEQMCPPAIGYLFG